jgi:hypothetical protein
MGTSISLIEGENDQKTKKKQKKRQTQSSGKTKPKRCDAGRKYGGNAVSIGDLFGVPVWYHDWVIR